MKKLSRVIKTVVGVLGLSLFLSACGNPNAALPTTATTSTTSTAAKTPFNLKLGKPYDGAKLKLLISSPTDAQYLSIKERTSEFTALTGITCEWDMGAYAGLFEKEMTESVSGSGTYDLFAVADAWGPALKNYLVPLDAKIKADGVDMTDFPAVFNTIIKMGTEVTYAMPLRGHFQPVFYRTDIYKELNLSIPKTWADLISNAKIIEAKKGIKGLSLNYGVSAGQNLMNWATFLRSYGSDFFDKGMKPIFNNAEGIAATQFYVDLMRKEKIVPESALTAIESDANKSMVQGKTAMFMGWSWMYGNYANKEQAAPEVLGNVGVFVTPQFKAGVDPVSSAFLFSVAITKSSKNQDAAWEYIKWMTNKDTDKKNVVDKSKYNTFIAVHLSTLADPEVNKTSNGTHALGVPLLNGAKSFPIIPEWAQVMGTLEVAINKAAAGGDVKALLDEAADAVTKMMERSGYYKK